MTDNLNIQSNSSLIKNDNETVVAFSPEELSRVQEIKNQIKVDDSQAIITFGVGAQRDIATFADIVLNEVRAKDSGFAGDILTNLVLKVKETDVDSLSGGGFLSRIPIIGNLVNSFKRFIERYEKLSVQIEKIVDELDSARMQMLKDITLLDNMYSKNLDYQKNLDLYIAAGELKIKELEATTLSELKTKAEQSRKPEDIQQYNDFNQFLNRLDKKIYDLKLSRAITVQTGPQLRLIQNGNQALVEKIQSSILNTIPLWKNQIVIAITLFRQKKALKLQQEVTNTTNDLLQKNAELLKESTIGIAKESERGIVDIETLKKVNDDLIATIEETLKIQADGKLKRQQAEQELVKIEDQLKNKLLSVKN